MGAVGSQVVSISSLLFGMSMLQMGNSLQGTLIGVRAIGEGFSANLIGMMSSGYFAGFIAGTVLTSYIIERAGHIRSFTALASLASAAVLGHIIIIDPFAWTILRALIGLSFAGIYVIMESWLKARSTNEHTWSNAGDLHGRQFDLIDSGSALAEFCRPRRVCAVLWGFGFSLNRIDTGSDDPDCRTCAAKAAATALAAYILDFATGRDSKPGLWAGPWFILGIGARVCRPGSWRE